MMNLRTLVEKTPNADLLREMIGFAAQRLMKREVEGQTGAAYGEKNPERLAQRKGYRDRIWETSRRCSRTSHPQAAQGLLLSGLPGVATHGWPLLYAVALWVQPISKAEKADKHDRRNEHGPSLAFYSYLRNLASARHRSRGATSKER